MKKTFILTLGILSAALSSNAQTIQDTTSVKAAEIQNSAIQNEVTRIMTEEFNYAGLIQIQNKLLKNRKTALVVFACGIGATLGGSIALRMSNSHIGEILYLSGLTAATTGSVWLIVSEVKIINNQRKLNDIRLSVIPGGVALKF